MKKGAGAGRRLANLRHELFCQLWVFGNPAFDLTKPAKDQDAVDTRWNATQSYIHAGYKARGNSASVNAHRLLRQTKIQVRISELRDEEQRLMTVHLQRWKTMLADAQAVLRKAMNGEDISAQAVTAAREVIEQAEGPSRFRFGVERGAGKDGGLSITLWSGRKE